MNGIRKLVAVVSLWWLAHGVTTIATKFMMEAGGVGEKVDGIIFGVTRTLESLRWLELTTLQHLFGAVASVLLLKAVNGKSTPIWPNKSPKVTICIATLANVVGNLATNSAYAASFASLSAKVVKACEPLFTFFLSLCLYNRDDFNLPTLFSVVAMITGITCTFPMLDTSFNVCGFLAALLSNIGFVTRNIYLKKLSWESTFQTYAVVSIGSILLLVPVALLKLVILSTHTNSAFLSGNVIASIFHFIYNTASITVLQDVSPLTHAILNLSRQACVVVANLVYFDTPLSPNLIIGLVIFILGVALYYKNTGNFKNKTSIYTLLVSCMIIGTLIFSILRITPQPTEDVTTNARENIYVTAQKVVTIDAKPISSVGMELSVKQIITAWVFERDLPQVALNNIKKLRAMNPEGHIHVYCGTSQCIRATSLLRGFDITTEFLVVSELVKDTPLDQWLARHPLNKVLAGLEFEDHLQIVTQLAILWKHGGAYVNPMVTFTDNTSLPSCQTGWIGKGGTNSILDISCFPKFHPLVQNIMKNFVRDYPQEGSDHSAFHFSFKNVMEVAYNSYCTSKSNCLANANLKYSADDQSKTLDHHFGTLSFDSRVKAVSVANLGDEIQGLPGMQFLPFINQFLERDKLSKLSTKEPVTIFFNAWWGDVAMNWPPPSNVHPIMTSVHIEGTIQRKWGNKIDYLNANAPIGCRDFDTLDFLRKKNVDSYFSGCLTLMLKNPIVAKERTNKIYLVDVKKEINELLPAEIQKNGIPVKHYVHTKDSLQRFTDSFKLIESYASAKLVVTQRIHCALPCVAMGIPVVFINSAGMPGGGGSKSHSSARTVGLTPLFHTVDMYKMSHEEAKKWLHNFNWKNPPPNPNVNMMMRMRATFWDVIRKNEVLHDAARKFGMIPLHPPPAQASEHHELLFHLLFTTSPESNVSRFGGDGNMKGAFNWRHWRTVESIFHHHPFARVIVHSNTVQQSEFDVLTEAGYTIEVQSYNLEDMLRDSPAQDFISKIQSAAQGEFWYSHVTDLLRLLVLYKWGGIYMDTDMVLVQPVNSLRNTLGSEGSSFFNGAFMAFEKDNAFIKDCLVDFAHNYSSHYWGRNGPDLISRNYDKWKNDRSIVFALRRNAFYMFHYSKINKECFGKVSQSLYDAKMKLLKEEAYAVHLNSKVTGKQGMTDKLEDGTLCKHILNAYCVLCDKQY